ncbi:hypothetical protein F7R91_07940 [Streptomyces luteolifulvus]|uniref:Uncharacterized protein n=2 Tax=Streptomyces luteolifulvus TaxID=2615112 RepID=A0A6H9V7E1_9ACTN|nr:hypothetical protein F7R91_07940 [Streptomyces luteolifulvus]
MMNADGKTNHDMTNSDIALLLADAADEVEIGIAPYDAVVRGGRRRRARRWAVTAATALALAASSATLAVAGLPGEGGGRVAPVATQPPTAEERHVYAPQQTLLATGSDGGRAWFVRIEVWGVPRDEVEAQRQLDAMAESGVRPVDVRQASELVGKISYFVFRSVGDKFAPVMQNTVSRTDTLSGTDIQAGALPLVPGSDGPQRLVIGKVAKTAQRVTCRWKGGGMTEIHRVPAGSDVNSDEQVIRPVDGSPYNWFVCLAPEGAAYKSVEVTK